MGLRDLLMNHGMAEGGLDLPDVLNALAKGAVLVDVRTAREYEAGHAPGTRLVSPKELLADPFTAVYGDDPLAEPNPHFILVCDTGFRSGHLVVPVREKGYNCDFLASGLHAWRAGGEILIPGPPRGR
ncbi:rhodanese-like domain-containing protein [Cutibacterium acnes]|uniref:rhodanese-like domain-containing protein n=1 Tax=Cutibacterium acnes TaxID=1747 RepID=UPI0021B4DFB6|nr:rhodanese-like domain-containing protein [Cutibacterium acnes]WGH45423.1 rhodanese-like domain-containing protein [Cutibacterium acnes]